MRFRWFIAGAVYMALCSWAAQAQLYWLTGVLAVVGMVLAIAIIALEL